MSLGKTGRVVHVEDSYTAVINLGLKDGVNKGENFLIYRLGKELFDPETNESLGQLEIVRGRAKVVHVQEKMSTLRTIESEVIPGAKRIIKRSSTGSFQALAMGLGDSREEVEDGPVEEDIPLDASVGDVAKPI